MNVDSDPEKKTTQESKNFSISLDSVQEFEFRVRFDQTQLQDLVIDEPAPLGHGKGPDPGRLLASAIGGCLSASLLFCAQKLRLPVKGLHTDIRVSHARNAKGRLRIGKLDVEIAPIIEEPDEQKLHRCLDLFEDFCVVTQSVRQGIEVSVKVKR